MTQNVFKQDLNFLNFPLWFQVSHTAEAMTWDEQTGYHYTAAYRAPDQLDMLFLAYLLMASQQANYIQKQDFSRYEVLKNCGCPINPQYLKRLEDSLRRWSEVTLKFEHSFISGGEAQSRQFQILDSWKLREKDRRLEVVLNGTFLKHIQESVYFKYIHFHYYRLLKRPVSRRLFEILAVMFKQSQQWKTPLVALGHQLTLYTRKRQKKNGEIEHVIYPSDVLTAVKAAVDEINALATDSDQLRELGMDPREIYAITYEVDKKRKSITFHRAALSHLFDELTLEPAQEVHTEPQTEPKLAELISFLKRNSKPLRELVTKAYYEYGYDYVKWNIFYANRNGSRNYVSYLKLCLQHNWAQEFREEYERMFVTPEEKLDERKMTALLKVAERADHLLTPSGKRFRIKRVFPNGALEISSRQYKMDFVLSPAQAYGCRFEQANPEMPVVRRGRKPKSAI